MAKLFMGDPSINIAIGRTEGKYLILKACNIESQIYWTSVKQALSQNTKEKKNHS